MPLGAKIAGANLVILLMALLVLDRLVPEARPRIGIAMAGLLLAALIVNLALVRLALWPVRELELTASRVLHGDRAARVEPSRLADPDLIRVGGALNALLDDLTADSARSRLLASQVISAQDDERGRIARELHDSVAQTLTALLLHLSVAVREERDAGSAQRLDDVRTMAVDALEEVRHLSHTVHPRVLDDLGLVAALEWLARTTRLASGVPVTVDASGDVTELPPPVASVLYRVAQEALGNAVRHADPDAVRISVTVTDGAAQLEVSDDGSGFDLREAEHRRPGMGLFSMRERTILVRGSLEIESSMGSGTRVRTSIPLAR